MQKRYEIGATPNNIIEANHGALKQMIWPARGFKAMKTAYVTIEGFEIMCIIRCGHCILHEPGVADEARFARKLFGLSGYWRQAEDRPNRQKLMQQSLSWQVEHLVGPGPQGSASVVDLAG